MCWKLYNLDDLSNRVCVPNKTVDLNLNIFHIITGINESKILTKHISCKCQYKFDGRKCKSNQNGITVSVLVSLKILKNIICAKKIIFSILLHVVVKMVNI